MFEPQCPDIGTIDDGPQVVQRAGFELLDDFILPRSDWLEGYYEPMTQRIELLRRDEPSPALAAVLDEAEQEIALYEQHGDTFGSAFYVARRA